MIDKILVLIKKFLLNVFNNHFKSLEHKIKYEILTSNLQDKAMNSVNSEFLMKNTAKMISLFL